jgi:hypothetical protein
MQTAMLENIIKQNTGSPTAFLTNFSLPHKPAKSNRQERQENL